MNKHSAFPIFMLTILLAACAGATPQESVESVNLAGKDPSCVRGCTATYSSCIQNAGTTENRLVANDILRACGGALKICAGTCPAK
jgi:hypothetical protein